MSQEDRKELKLVEEKIENLKASRNFLEDKKEQLEKSELRFLREFDTELEKLEAKEKYWQGIIEKGISYELTIATFNAPGMHGVRNIIPIPVTDTNEGVPGTFRTYRTTTIQRFHDLLYSVDVPRKTVLFIKAPPFSGKTGLAQLLCQKLMEDVSRSVIFLTCQRMKPEENFETFFNRSVEIDYIDFTEKQSFDRVIVLDEAQCTYNCEYLWKTTIKDTLGNKNRGLRIILLSSFGSYDPLGISLRQGTPISVPLDNQFNLFQSDLKPGLGLYENEFEEMIKGSPYYQSKDVIWNLCSNHIGMANITLVYLRRMLNNYSGVVDESIVERALRSNDFLRHIISFARGIPSYKALQTIIENYKLHDFRDKMFRVVERVSLGEILKLDSEAISAGSREPTELLIKYGFLFEDDEGYLHFASQMHVKAWLFSTRHDPLPGLAPCMLFQKFVALAISRMHSSHLAKIRQLNDDMGVRERQMQMELYSGIVSLLPKDTYVTPEWRTDDKKGYVDLVIEFIDGTFWFLELLVDGVGAKEHSQRFEKDGKYYTSMIANSKYALIDFRENVKERKVRENFMYVSFSNSYSKAKIAMGDIEEIVFLKP
jgi:hypothetical protein